MARLERALISVSDKTGIAEFARELQHLGVEIISTGGTSKLLKENGIRVMEISEYTGFPEIMDGRVKTLHPKVHGGLLGLRDNEAHKKQMKDLEIKPIDMVVVNLYPFEKTIAKKGVSMPKEVISSPAAPAAVGPYSQAIKVGPLLFVSGQIPLDVSGNKVSGGVSRETDQCLENLKAVLAAAGASLEQVVKVTVFMTDLGDFKFMNQAYEKHFTSSPPARSTVQVVKLPKDVHVEIEAIAVVA